MPELITKLMLANGNHEWSWPFAYGMLLARVEDFLRGHTSRDSLTALVARLNIEHDAYSSARARGLRPSEALREIAGLTQTLAAGAPPSASPSEHFIATGE